MKKFFVAAAALVASSQTALAVADPFAVPEISALEGTAALAAIAAIVLFAWERRRRAA
jgi:hypothetical protein